MPLRRRFREVRRPRYSGNHYRPVEHPGSAAKAALNDCPHERKAKGAHLAAFVSCIPLFDGTPLFLALSTWDSWALENVWNLGESPDVLTHSEGATGDARIGTPNGLQFGGQAVQGDRMAPLPISDLQRGHGTIDQECAEVLRKREEVLTTEQGLKARELLSGKDEALGLMSSWMDLQLQFAIRADGDGPVAKRPGQTRSYGHAHLQRTRSRGEGDKAKGQEQPS